MRDTYAHNTWRHRRRRTFPKRSQTDVRYSFARFYSIQFYSKAQQDTFAKCFFAWTNRTDHFCRLLKTYRKINTFSFVISYFSSQQWNFCDDAVVKLWERVNPADRQIFNFNIMNLNWKTYISHMIPGIRVYMIKDPLCTVQEGRKRYRR